jgi:uncharacterized iron-regulated membrane protein
VRVRSVALLIHRYLGLASGTIIVIVGLTGALLVFAGPLDRALNPGLWKVGTGGKRLSPDSVVALLESRHPGRQARSVRLPADGTSPFVIAFRGSHGGRTVFVDPYTGRVLGEREPERTLVGRVEGMHTSLLIGKPGLFAIVASTILMLFLLASGYVLWWPRTKTESKRSFTLRWNAGWKRLLYDAHNVFGFYASAYLILIAVTGLFLSFPLFSAAVYRITGGERPPTPPRSEVVEGASRISLSEAARVAETAVGHGTVTSISIPNRPRQAIRVALATPEGGARGRRTVYVDQFSGAPLRVDPPDQRSRTASLLELTGPIHTGTVLGLPTRLLAFLASLVGGLLPMTGALIWYPRWRAKRRHSRS